MLLQPSFVRAPGQAYALKPLWCSRQPGAWHSRGSLKLAARARDLWEYEGTRVQEMNLETLKFQHRMSYGHRNRKTVMVVVYDPTQPSCQASEFEVERLASGLSHEPTVLIAKFNVGHKRGSQPTAEATFAAGVLGVDQLPTVLMYPLGTPGVMRYRGSQITAEALLDSINRIHHTITPMRPSMVLLGVPDSEFTHQAAAGAGASTTDAAGTQQGAVTAVAAATQEGAGKCDSKGKKQSKQQHLNAQELVLQRSGQGEASAVPGDGEHAGGGSDAAAQVMQTLTGRGAVATEAVSTADRPVTAASSSSSTSQVASVGVTPTKWKGARPAYWTPGKAFFWGAIAVLSVASVVWERWVGPRLEARRLLARQAERAAGRGDQFDEETNLQDLFILKQLEVQAAQARGKEPLAGIGRYSGVRIPSTVDQLSSSGHTSTVGEAVDMTEDGRDGSFKQVLQPDGYTGPTEAQVAELLRAGQGVRGVSQFVDDQAHGQQQQGREAEAGGAGNGQEGDGAHSRPNGSRAS